MLIAILVSVAFLMLQTVMMPHVRKVDDALAVATHLSLVILFIAILVVKVRLYSYTCIFLLYYYYPTVLPHYDTSYYCYITTNYYVRVAPLRHHLPANSIARPSPPTSPFVPLCTSIPPHTRPPRREGTTILLTYILLFFY